MALCHHYFLISGTILFTMGEGEDEQISTMIANAIVRHDDTKFPAHKLGKAQQNLFKSMMMKLPEEARPGIIARDIVIQSVSYLGLMTEEEFQAEPELLTPMPAQSVI